MVSYIPVDNDPFAGSSQPVAQPPVGNPVNSAAAPSQTQDNTDQGNGSVESNQSNQHLLSPGSGTVVPSPQDKSTGQSLDKSAQNVHGNSPKLIPIDYDPFAKPAQSNSTSPSRSTGEQLFRQAGLAGRDIAGAVPMALAGTGDAVNMAINGTTGLVNKYGGTNIPQLGMPTDTVQQGLSKAGFPDYENGMERGVGTAANVLLGDGESIVPTAKAMAQNAWGYLKSAPATAAAQLKKAASQVYNGSRAAGVVFNDDAASGLAAATQKGMTDTGKMNAGLHPLSQGVMQDLKDATDKGDFGLDDLDAHRQLFGQVIDKDTDVAGNVGPDGMKAQAAKQAMDAWLKNIDPASSLKGGDPDAIDNLVNYARPTWAQAAKLQDVERMMKRASMMQNPVNSLKTGARNMLMSGDTNGWSAEEKAGLEKMANTGIGVDTVNLLGSRLIPIIATGAGGATGGWLGATATGLAAQGVTTVARKAATAMQMGKGKDLANIIANGAPLKVNPNPSSWNAGPGAVAEAPVAGALAGAAAPDKNPSGQAHGGKVRTGSIYSRPKSYPALEAMRVK